MKIGNIFFEKKIILAAAIYFFVSFFLLYYYGIQLGGEAEKYIDNANRILQQQELRNGFFGIFYFSYSVIIAVFIKCSISLTYVAIVQIGLSFLAAMLLYKIVLQTLANQSIAFLFFCAYLFCYPIQKWNFFLYSESLHTSLLVIGGYLFLKAMQSNKSSAWLLFSLVSLFILFSRPVGIIFFFGSMMVLITWCFQQGKKWWALLLSILSLAMVIGIVNSPITAFINPDSLKRMEIICQVPEMNTGSNYEEFNRSGLFNAFRVIRDEVGVGHFLMAGGKKMGYFFGMIRSYYSWQNNLLLLLYCIFYPFVLIGIFTKSPPQFYYIKRLSLIYLAFTSVAVFFTCDDWANRFISPAFPFILLLAAGGIYILYRKCFIKEFSKN